MNAAERKAYWFRYARENARYERSGVAHFQKAILTTIAPAIQYAATYGPQAALANLDTLFDRRIIERAFIDFYVYVGKAHYQWAEKDIKTRLPKERQKRGIPSIDVGSADSGFGANFFNPAWLRRLKNLVYSLDVAKRVTSVSNTIKKKLRAVLGRAVKEEVRPSAIARRMHEEMDGAWSEERAKLIARTETTYIANAAAKESAYESVKGMGIKLDKIWIHTQDERVRDTHWKNPDPIGSDEKFTVGNSRMDFPGDPAGGASECCNCRCTVAYLPSNDREDIFPDPYLMNPLPKI